MMEKVHLRGRRILVAAAHAQTRSFLSVLLTDHGFFPEEVEDGAALLERLRRYPPAAVIVDFNGSGTAWLRRARTTAPETPIVLIGNGQGLTPAEAAEIADGYLDRPVRPDELLFTLYRLLREPERGDIPRTAPGSSQGTGRLRHAQRIELVGRVASGVAHDLNNLVTVLLGHGELLLSSDPTPAGVREHASAIREAASRAASLTRRLLAMSRRTTPKPSRLNVNLVLGDMSRLLRSIVPAEIELSTELDPLLDDVEADLGEVEQVVMNLILNARDAILERRKPAWKGRVMLRTQPGELAGQRAVVLSVLDNGCGMTPEVRARLFEPFFTTKPEGRGTGLGMGIVADIVRQYGGSVEIDTEVGRGTEFRILLPVAAEGAPRDQGGKAGGPAGGRGEAASANTSVVLSPSVRPDPQTILVVEDNEQVAELTGTVLRGCGYHVLLAHDGVQALAIGRAEAQLDLLVADLGLPGMNGQTIARHLRTARPGLGVLFITGESLPEAMSRELEGLPLLEKPFTPETLSVRVQQVLDDRSRGRS